MPEVKKPVKLAFLTPSGRAPRRADVSFAHAAGVFLSGGHVSFYGLADGGEVSEAFLAGARTKKADIQLWLPGDVERPILPGSGELTIIPLAANETGAEAVAAEVDAILAFAPRVADLQRYFSVWTAASTRPTLCLAAGDEFRLIRGFIADVVSPGRPRYAEKLLFAHTPEEGWDMLKSAIG
ncbi:MAG: hypothetical protein GXP01_08300 [Alphaproteobacteria bacterium]|nr:hypothetical protein [Alphaproteobacteria bacterium]